MNAILTIAWAALLEHRRRKLILFFTLFTLLVMGGLVLLARSAQGEVFFLGGNPAVLLSDGFLQLFALLATVAVSMGNIGEQFSSGQVMSVLARPVARWQFALGRLLGSIGVVLGLCALIAAELNIVTLAAGESAYLEIWEHWGVAAFNLTVIAVITTLISVGISTPIVAAILGFVVNQAVGAVEFARFLVREFQVTGFLRVSIDVVWYLMPKFLTSSLSRSRLVGAAPEDFIRQPALIELWAGGYLVALVVVILLLVERKQIK